MSAQPIHEEDPRDPQVILHGLPEREHPAFLRRYQEAVDAARDPAGYRQLQHVLETWSAIARVLTETLRENPNYYADIDAEIESVRNGTVKTVPIEQVFPDWDTHVAAGRAQRHPR